MTTSRAARAQATREQILTAAERLFAEHGVFAVSNRQVAEAAGQGNNTVVGYHFGTKADLVRAVIRRHATAMEQRRGPMVAEVAGSTEVRDWVTCLVRPLTDHLASLGSPTWFARFAAQVMTDPSLRPIMEEEALSSLSLNRIVDGLHRSLPDLPGEVRDERGGMLRHLMVHMMAERELALAEHTHTPRSSWQDAGTGLIDALVGLWLAPVTTIDEKEEP
ncbi:TetR family transcriptional regulator [Crossiella sp. NPDC003009]